MTREKEHIFLDKIDCNFPYYDKQECLLLIDEAVAISANAVFSVIEEICRITVAEKKDIRIEFLLQLLEVINIKFDYPIKEMILNTAEKMVRDEYLSVDDVISKMDIVKKYRGQYSALSILCFSCDDKDERLEPIWNDILNGWNNKKVEL